MTDQPWQPAAVLVLAILGFFAALLTVLYVVFGRKRDSQTPHG